MFDWQVIVVACVLLLAGAYVGRRGWLRISSLAISKRNAPSCDKACGHCEGEGLVGPQFSPTSRSEEKSRHLKRRIAVTATFHTLNAKFSQPPVPYARFLQKFRPDCSARVLHIAALVLPRR